MAKRLLVLAFAMVFALACAFAADGPYIRSALFTSDAETGYCSQLGLDGYQLSASPSADRAVLAIGNPDYPVTPGDTYVLTYFDGNSAVSSQIQVDARLLAQVPSIGVVDACGMTFLQFKAYVEDAISSVMSYSKPSLALAGCGLFQVKVAGAVNAVSHVTCWGLARVSDLAPYAADYASTRDVVVTYSDGSIVHCDLFAALAEGSDKDNPLLKSGATVTFSEAGSKVSIEGAVNKSGLFQIESGEGLAAVIGRYGKGFASDADTSSLAVIRADGSLAIARGDDSSFVLKDGDRIVVAKTAIVDKTVTIEGAVPGRLAYSFFPGETLGQLVSAIAPMTTQGADISAVAIVREGQTIGEAATALQDGDVIIVPFANLDVVVSGAVYKPGSYAYVPGKGVMYYIGQAGGFTADAKKGTLEAFDANGVTVDCEGVVPAGALVTVERRNTNIASTLTMIATVLSLVTGIVGLVRK